MADSAQTTASAQDGSKPPVTELTIRSKEMQYMELLEKRIADLEAKLKESEKVQNRSVPLHENSYQLTKLRDRKRTKRWVMCELRAWRELISRAVGRYE